MFNFVRSDVIMWLYGNFHFRKCILNNLGQSSSASALTEEKTILYWGVGGVETLLCIEGCWVVTLLYPLHKHSFCDNQNCLQTLPNIPWGGQNHSQLRTINLSLNTMKCVILLNLKHLRKNTHKQKKYGKH